MHKVLRSPMSSQVTLDEAPTLRTLNEFAVDVITIPSVEDLFWYVARNVVGRLNFVDCVIYEADEAQTELTQVAALGEKNPYGRTILNPLKIPFGQGITGQAAQTREAIVVGDLMQDQNYIPDTLPARSEICVPLVIGDRVVGVIDSEHRDVDAFGDAELEVLITVAAMTSAKLELLAEAERSNRRYHELVQSHAQLTQEISNRKALEAQLFNVRKHEAIGRLTGGFAHDFNNLLTVISGNLELIGIDVGDAQTQASLKDARAAADQAAKHIQSMLAFSQRMRLEPKPCDLNALVTATFEQSTRDHPAQVQMDLAGDLWGVHIDPIATEMALLNLIRNAQDAMPLGGVLRVTTANMTAGLTDPSHRQLNMPPGQYVRLSVADEGEGISAETLQQVFDPFYTTKPVGEGTGLGLSMVQGFVQQSGGAVVATPRHPQGTTFDLYFPVADSKINDLLTKKG